MNNTAKLSLMIVRTLVLIFILIQAIKGVCSENISDTLEISDDGKAFIVMKEDISYVDFGKDKANFRTEIVTNVLKIIAIKPFNQTTLWIATVDKEYKLFIIRYKKIPAK